MELKLARNLNLGLQDKLIKVGKAFFGPNHQRDVVDHIQGGIKQRQIVGIGQIAHQIIPPFDQVGGVRTGDFTITNHGNVPAGRVASEHRPEYGGKRELDPGRRRARLVRDGRGIVKVGSKLQKAMHTGGIVIRRPDRNVEVGCHDTTAAHGVGDQNQQV
ncbi:MAG: hypothetical protein BWX80_04152 [Candidatus Hydrogenedentes bacterium ADurb.Bin101]|nr:MAG: hypothetical protein BWX80_04152 [Candidatus Hydrogenedentes bacterium ADurb.Bin101]